MFPRKMRSLNNPQNNTKRKWGTLCFIDIFGLIVHIQQFQQPTRARTLTNQKSTTINLIRRLLIVTIDLSKQTKKIPNNRTRSNPTSLNHNKLSTATLRIKNNSSTKLLHLKQGLPINQEIKLNQRFKWPTLRNNSSFALRISQTRSNSQLWERKWPISSLMCRKKWAQFRTGKDIWSGSANPWKTSQIQ